MVNLIEEETFNKARQKADTSKEESSDTIHIPHHQTEPRLTQNGDNNHGSNYKLVRTFSESEANNFDSETGHRIFEDGKIRPKTARANTNQSQQESPIKLYSRSHNEYIDAPDSGYVAGLEDEYIPGLDFGDLIYRWNKSSSENLSTYEGEGVPRSSATTSISNTPLSRNQSYLDLNELHAQVAPQPIKLRNQENKLSFTKLHDAMKLRTPSSNSLHDPLSTSVSKDTSAHRSKKQKSHRYVDQAHGDINYEQIIESLPSNFNDLPYSQRKKIVQSFSDSIDYSQFSLFAKDYLTKFGEGRSSRSGSTAGSLSRLSRRNSTVAGRLLALSSSSDIKKLNEPKKKVNVDEKGAQVMEYELGKIIGYGAWGTIRECTDDKGTVRAVKIVKSCRERDESPARSRSRSPSRIKANNNQVLEFFKKEIKIWEQLHHANILPLIKYLETENIIFCFTDKIPGGTLFDHVLQWGMFDTGLSNSVGPITFLLEAQKERLLRTASFVKQIVEGLRYMHQEKGIVHGDLKLENVLVDDNDANDIKMILCDFGMSRVYTSRLNRAVADHESSPTLRSRSSFTRTRKPYHGGHSKHTTQLFTDDSKIGLSNLFKSHGPSMQSVTLTPTESLSLADAHELKIKFNHVETIDSGLPHSHIGSLPYASPELLLPSPPPLGPSADVWALGVLTYTMIVGRLPFQHPYEPRLRAMITAGQFDKDDLALACLMQWNHTTGNGSADASNSGTAEVMSGSSFTDGGRASGLDALAQQWSKHDCTEFKYLHDLVNGCLELNITKRWDLEMVKRSLEATHC